MALPYPSLLAAVTDVRWRATSLWVYRMWRDLDYAVGALSIGAISGIVGLEYGFYLTAIGMFAGGSAEVRDCAESQEAGSWLV